MSSPDNAPASAACGPAPPEWPTDVTTNSGLCYHNIPEALEATSNLATGESLLGHTNTKGNATPSEQDESSNGGNSLTRQNTFPNLQRAMQSESAENLERYTQIGLSVVNDLLQRLNEAKHCRDAFHWLKSLKELMRQSERPQYILGVIGATGHGKSCLINALLGEARLVPTNCMRACTAVITEISWNPSDDPEERYVAKIEFISMEEWRYELDQLFSDIMASSGEVTGDINNKATDAGVAWAKIQAVYPHISNNNLTKTNADSLANDPAVSSLLGVTKTVYGTTAKAFYKDIRVYVDSREKHSGGNVTDMAHDDHSEPSTQDDSENGFGDEELTSDDSEYQKQERNTEEREPATKERKMELWPLIKVVRIQTKADVLSTGAVIVDLVSLHEHMMKVHVLLIVKAWCRGLKCCPRSYCWQVH